MTARQLAKYRAALVTLRAETVASGVAKIEPNRQDPTNVSTSDEDAQALSEMLQTLSSERNRQKADLLARIDRALRRIADAPDEFGQCEECEEDIPAKRLELMPHASLCAECQAKRDPRRGQRRKSVGDIK